MTQKQERLLQQDINARRKKIELKLHIGAVDYHVMQNYSDLNQASQDSGRPYTDLEITDDYILREFSETIDPIELLWHRDDEARTVEIIGETDWMLQLDNNIPTPLTEKVSIPKNTYHRVIKGSGDLKVRIKKL